MNKRQKIEEEVEKTLSLLDNVEKLEPNPYLYTRIKASLNKNKFESPAAKQKESFALKLLPAFFVLLILFNFYSLFDLATSVSDDTNDYRTEYLQEISSEYMLSQSAYYPITME